MIRAGVNDAQGQSCFLKINIQLFNHRILRILKIDGKHISHGGGGLIHQPAGFPKIHVLRVLSDLGDLHRSRLSLKKQGVDNISDQHFESR